MMDLDAQLAAMLSRVSGAAEKLSMPVWRDLLIGRERKLALVAGLVARPTPVPHQ
jgi:hypothetical protein